MIQSTEKKSHNFPHLNKITIPGYRVHDWIVDWVYANSGIIVENKSIEQLVKESPPVFLTYETELWKDLENLLKIMQEGNIKSMVIISLHVYSINEKHLKRMSEAAVGKEITILSMSNTVYGIEKYKNLKCYTFDIVEHGISNDFNFLLTLKLKENRNPTKDFLYFVNQKDNFRNTVYNFLKSTDIFDNSLIFANAPGKVEEIEHWYKDFFEVLNTVSMNNNVYNAIRSYGGTLPNYKAYETGFCEIVIESKNDGDIGDLSEKTYRPLSLNIPFVFLGHPLMYEKLKKDGYMIVDNGTFYKEWHQDIELEKKLPALLKFLRQIKHDNNLRKQLEIAAQHNYDIFWTRRKFNYIENNYKILTKCFGTNLVEGVYKSLDR